MKSTSVMSPTTNRFHCMLDLDAKFLASINSSPSKFDAFPKKEIYKDHKFQKSIWEVEIQYPMLSMMVKLKPRSAMI